MSNGLLEINDEAGRAPAAGGETTAGGQDGKSHRSSRKGGKYRALSINLFKDEKLAERGKSSMLSGAAGGATNHPGQN